MTANPAAPLYPGSDAPGTPGRDLHGAVTIRPSQTSQASRATPTGQELDTPSPGMGVVLVSGAGVEPTVAPPAPAGGALENYANNSSPAGHGPDYRGRRYARRALLWAESGIPRVRKCGKVTRTEGGRVGVRVASGVAGFSGLCTCGSVWACPVCNAKIMARRRLEVQTVVAIHQANAGRVLFGTLTLRHRAGQRLSDLWDCVAQSWSAVTSGKQWSALIQAGVLGFLRVVEVTWGNNGWHVHIHFLLFLPAGVDQVDDLGEFMWRRWQSAVAKRGFESVRSAQDFRLLTGPADVDLSAYLAKQTDLGWELTSSQTKDAGKTRPVWELLSRIVDDGDAEALDLWHEWEQGSFRRRQMTWSNGLRETFGLAKDLTDEEIAREVAGDEDLVLIEPDGWAVLVADPPLIPRVLRSAEVGGVAGLLAFLDAHRVRYVRGEV